MRDNQAYFVLIGIFQGSINARATPRFVSFMGVIQIFQPASRPFQMGGPRDKPGLQDIFDRTGRDSPQVRKKKNKLCNFSKRSLLKPVMFTYLTNSGVDPANPSMLFKFDSNEPGNRGRLRPETINEDSYHTRVQSLHFLQA